MERRLFLQTLTAGSLAGLLPNLACTPAQEQAASGIDRRALVARHHPVVRAVDPFSVLSVGNGRFVFTADITGLQTFPDTYTDIPLATQSEWGWHTFPNPEGYTMADAQTPYDTYGRAVPYADQHFSEAGQWLRQSPHRLSLARLGFDLRRADGTAATASDLHDMEQHLDLWSGLLTSRFRLEEQGMRVQTCVHPARDILAVRIEGDLDAARRAIRLVFPYGAPVHTGDPGVWDAPDLHQTQLIREGATTARWLRTLDADTYVVRAQWAGGTVVEQEHDHGFRLVADAAAPHFDLVLSFAAEESTTPLPSFDDVQTAATNYWEQFWQSGGAVDLSGSTDPRASELERRIVLSQYLTAIQCAGTQPPQETGLTFNSWHGKFHLEMHWWHAVHFALWNRLPLLERSLPWYQEILPMAQETARLQGYEGARWPKMVSPDGRDSPSTIGVFLIWQQPHPIYFAELIYRARPEPAVLETYREVVFETAAFMASYPFWDEAEERYILGPPLIPAQELHPPRTTFNPTFELAYWRFGLETAQQWRERLGLPREESWDHVLDHLSSLPTRDGLYTNAESDPDTFTDIEKRRDHPTLLGAYGFVESPDVDPEIMRRTLQRVMSDWQWEETWGWDYPLVAMTATRLGEPDIAIEALLMETQKNRYHPNGHNYQREGLTIYLPGNGGLLAAVAMMAAGWEGGPDTHAPGFPEGWAVQWEGLQRFL